MGDIVTFGVSLNSGCVRGAMASSVLRVQMYHTRAETPVEQVNASLLWPFFVSCYLSQGFSYKVSSVHVHSLGYVILRLQHMLL